MRKRGFVTDKYLGVKIVACNFSFVKGRLMMSEVGATMSVGAVLNFSFPFMAANFTPPPDFSIALWQELAWHIRSIFFETPFLC